MPADDSLKRLGGGRWETRDGRFAIEPQSGTWVVVDNEQTDDLGLPLVRGPFGSLTAARVAIDGIRTSGPAESPLSGRLKEAAAGAEREERAGRAKRTEPAAATSRRSGRRVPGPEARPEREAAVPPPEPRWLQDLAPADRRRARELIERLERLGVDEAAEIARAEIARDEPALARVAIARRLRSVIASATAPDDAVRAALKALSTGRDRELDVRWRLVDDRGRPLGDLDVEG